MVAKKWLTRKETAAILKVSKNGVAYHHGKSLTPTQDKDGVWHYNADEVSRLSTLLSARRKKVPFQDQPGALARAVFHAFDAGMPLTEIVKSYAVEPERVRELYTEYITACGEPLPVEFTPKQILEREELAFKAQAERNRVELARERAHAASQRRREG